MRCARGAYHTRQRVRLAALRTLAAHTKVALLPAAVHFAHPAFNVLLAARRTPQRSLAAGTRETARRKTAPHHARLLVRSAEPRSPTRQAVQGACSAAARFAPLSLDILLRSPHTSHFREAWPLRCRHSHATPACPVRTPKCSPEKTSAHQKNGSEQPACVGARTIPSFMCALQSWAS